LSSHTRPHEAELVALALDPEVQPLAALNVANAQPAQFLANLAIVRDPV